MEKRFSNHATAAGLTCTLLLALASLLVASARIDDDVEDTPRFSDWSAPVNLGPPVSTLLTGSPSEGADFNPFISRDGLSLYFASDRPGGFGGFDIWVSERPSVSDPWGEPQNLGPNVNTPSTENSPALSPDGRRLYFQSDRPGGFGKLDLYVSERRRKRDNLAWQAATNLAGNIDTLFDEFSATLFEDDETGTTTLYFTSNRPGVGGNDIYASILNDDDEEETFQPAVLVPELSTPDNDGSLVFRRDGLEVIHSASRPGSIGGNDLWVRTRASTSDPWSPPVNLGPVVNTQFQENRPALSRGGTELYSARTDLAPEASTSTSAHAPSSSSRTEQRVRLREKRPIQSAGSRPLNPSRFASVALLPASSDLVGRLRYGRVARTYSRRRLWLPRPRCWRAGLLTFSDCFASNARLPAHHPNLPNS